VNFHIRQEEWAVFDLLYLGTYISLQVREGMKFQVASVNAGLLSKSAPQIIIVEGKHPTVGVVDNQHLSGA